MHVVHLSDSPNRDLYLSLTKQLVMKMKTFHQMPHKPGSLEKTRLANQQILGRPSTRNSTTNSHIKLGLSLIWDSHLGHFEML